MWGLAWGCRFNLHRMRSVHAGLRFFSLRRVGGEKEGEKGWQENKKLPPTSLLEPLTPGAISGPESPGPQLEHGMAADWRGPKGIKIMLAFVRLRQGPSVWSTFV